MNTDPITYEYEVEGRKVEITRRHTGTAYARNGNVGNPTEYFVWDADVDGERIGGYYESRSVAYEYARAHILGIDYYSNKNHPNKTKNVRHFQVVAEEMKKNYKRKVTK